MYIPLHFEVSERAWVLDLIEQHPFGSLITDDDEYPRVSHLPLIAQERQDGVWLVGHVARNNPHAQSIAAQAPATLVFRGPHAYVSASWYEEPYATVPTWNYTAAHVCGRLRQYDAWHAVKLLSAKVEGGKANAWDPQRLDPRFRESQLRAIVAFEMRADAMYGKAKLSQNRSEADRARVIRKLSASPNQIDRECAQAMLTELEAGARGSREDK
jgi:transcriptional regulator